MPTLNWQKSTYSGSGSNCLDVAATCDGAIKLRESDAPDTIITTTPAHLKALLQHIKRNSPSQHTK